MQAIRALQTIAIIENIPRRRKTYQKRYDPFSLPDEEFQRRYRFKKPTLKFIIDLVREDIKLDNRGRGTSPELQVLTAIRCWGRREVSASSTLVHALQK